MTDIRQLKAELQGLNNELSKILVSAIPLLIEIEFADVIGIKVCPSCYGAGAHADHCELVDMLQKFSSLVKKRRANLPKPQ